jgi:O-succinylbenzoic acid--CoA ligase
MILFTSGTTGPAKGVRLTWENWEAAVAASAAHLGHGPDDTWLAVMPLHHVGGLAILLRSAYVGARVRWLPSFRTDEVVRSLRSGVTFASLVPAMLRRVLDHDRGHYHSLRAVLVGGGPIPPGLLEEAHARGIPALPTYGMTETCAQVATLRPGSPLRYAVHLVAGMEARLDGDGRIELRGRQVSPGYLDDDDRPAQGWLPTGDLGSFEPDGALRVLGRADSVIITGGEKVDPGRVEAVISDHPGVESVTVRGEADPEWGQRIVACYRGVVTPEELREWCRSRLAYYEVPRRFVREEPRAQSS